MQICPLRFHLSFVWNRLLQRRDHDSLCDVTTNFCSSKWEGKAIPFLLWRQTCFNCFLSLPHNFHFTLLCASSKRLRINVSHLTLTFLLQNILRFIDTLLFLTILTPLLLYRFQIMFQFINSILKPS